MRLTSRDQLPFIPPSMSAVRPPEGFIPTPSAPSLTSGLPEGAQFSTPPVGSFAAVRWSPDLIHTQVNSFDIQRSLPSGRGRFETPSIYEAPSGSVHGSASVYQRATTYPIQEFHFLSPDTGEVQTRVSLTGVDPTFNSRFLKERVHDAQLMALAGAEDRALAASLSAAVYTDNAWMIETLDQPWDRIPFWRLGNVKEDSDAAQITRACWLKSIYQPVSNEEIGLPSLDSAKDPIDGSEQPLIYNNGMFYFGSLACAALVKRERHPGGPVFELCFRGTEKETTGDQDHDKSNLIKGYFLSAYKNLDGHYERHRALIDKVHELMARPENQGAQLHVSGHSLGGAMAEMFFKKDASKLPPTVTLRGFTFGSPGIGAPQSAFSMLAKGFARLILSRLGLFDRTPAQKTQAQNFRESASGADTRLVQFIDPADPIPKIGRLGGYNPAGDVFFARKPDRDSAGVVIPNSLLGISWHSMSLYEDSRVRLLLDADALASETPGAPRSKLVSLHSQALNQERELFDRVRSPEALSHVQFDELREALLRQAKSRDGMINPLAPNAQADTNNMIEGLQNLGTGLLKKLQDRRDVADAERIANLQKGLGIVKSLSKL